MKLGLVLMELNSIFLDGFKVLEKFVILFVDYGIVFKKFILYNVAY